MKFKRIFLAAAALSTTMSFASTADEIAKLQEQIDELKEGQAEIAKHDGDDNLKWGVDFRTSYDNINYDMADGKSKGNDNLYSMRLWLNMAYTPDDKNLFFGQLSMNKAFGADFQSRANGRGSTFDWVTNEALTDNTITVRKAYWVYLGENAFGQENLPWTVSIGRRPSANTFLANLSQDDEAESSLGHIMNVHVDALSAHLNFDELTGIPGMSVKFCAGLGSTNAEPLFTTSTPYAENDDNLDSIRMTSVLFQFYNDERFILKAQWYKGWDLPGQEVSPIYTDANGNPSSPGSATNVSYGASDFNQYGDIQGGALSGLIDGITEEGYFSDAKVFASYAMSRTEPFSGKSMLGSTDNETGHSYWVGAYLPVGEENEYGTLGLEYNHGDKYWRPFTYAEDTMIGSKIAARGDAYELNYTYHINEALSLQARYVNIDYKYTGSNGFFGNYSGNTSSIDDVKAGAASWNKLTNGADPTNIQAINDLANQVGTKKAKQLAGAAQSLPNIVEAAQDFRFYIRYRF